MTKCRVCAFLLKKFFSLGEMPLVNSFLRKEDIKNEKKYDLSLGFCKNCYLVQLMEIVNPEELFRDYVYFSSVTKSVLDHSKKTANKFIKRFNLSYKSFVLEIGSNDGANLQFYKNVGIPILGVDPAVNVTKVANLRGINTIADFFNLHLAQKLTKTRNIKADLVYGANVLAHVPKIVDFVKGVRVILKSAGTAVFEFPYIKGLLENKFDTIYHEHVFYYSLIALRNLFNKADLEIYDVEFIPMQGGSLRIYAGHFKKFKISNRVKNLLKNEILEDYDKIITYKNMNTNVNKLKRKISSYLINLKKQGKMIAAYGAPAKGITLLNSLGIAKHLDFIVDKAPTKQGLYTPGVHILVYPPQKIFDERPNYVLILSWNIAEEVMLALYKYKKQGGKFIIPIPQVKVV